MPSDSPSRTAASKVPTSLGVEIVALGIRAARVFAGCSFVPTRFTDRHVDFVVADRPSETESRTVPVVVLSESRRLAVPAFDPGIHNPVGWERDVDYVVGSLGPRGLLPPGLEAHRLVAHDDTFAVRRCHHLVDTAAFHAGEIERAGVLVRLAASGAPVYLVDGGPGLDELIGPELHTLMTKDLREIDADERELHSIKTRRAALREHSFRSRAMQMSVTVLDDPPEVPVVSILLATKRPDFLEWAIGNVSRQDYPRLQLVLALHGDGFNNAEVERVVGSLGFPVRVVRVRENQTLGTVLNTAVNASCGTLLVKMDDDDLYGPDHIWDLVLAHEYSGAQLVGKHWLTTYLAHRDHTLKKRRPVEVYGWFVCGGALLISRHDLERVGGWQRIPSGEDSALMADVIRNDGSVYRTHGSGYMIVRHGQSHTWEPDDSHISSGVHAVVPGWQPAMADIENAPDPPQWLCRNERESRNRA